MIKEREAIEELWACKLFVVIRPYPTEREISRRWSENASVPRNRHDILVIAVDKGEELSCSSLLDEKAVNVSGSPCPREWSVENALTFPDKSGTQFFESSDG